MIRILEKQVADKIAAGEVVDRPLSVVKELVENSIDSGADNIVCEIKNGGKSYIRVTDNGCGIPSDEVGVAFARHATSKIFTDSDLESIRTLGFRGEALASICAVSNVEMLTKTKNEKPGTRTILRGGDTVESAYCGCPDGTTVVVTDLFYNTPARMKFMKADNTESSLIIDFISRMAIAYPHVKVRLISNGNILFSTNGRGDLYNTVMTVYGKSVGSELLPVDLETDYASVRGYVSAPSASKTNRKYQIFFVNGRSVQSKVIEKGLSEAYSDRLFEGRYPVAFLFLQITPDKLDVNIHPNKREVRFDDEAFVRELTAAAVRNALNVRSAIPQIRAESVSKAYFASDAPVEYKGLRDTEGDDGRFSAVGSIREEQVDLNILLSTMREESQKNDAASALSDAFSEEKQTSAMPFRFEDLRPTGSIFASYITAVDDDSFYLIDQHAAHERIFFERLLAEFKSAEKHSQPCLLPMLKDVTHALAERSEDWIGALEAMGYEIEPFGQNTFAVKAVPMFMEPDEAESFIRMFLDNMDERTDFSDYGMLERIITKACKSAVKANDTLREEEINALLAQLAACQNPYSCPHGRPTFIRLRKYEIEKMFKRV